MPASANNTWADGLARLFLGYAVPGFAQSPWAGLLPAGGAEGLGAQALGSLWAFIQALGDLQARTASPLPAAQWVHLLQALVPRFMHAHRRDSAADDALLGLQKAITDLAAGWQGSQQQRPLSLAVVRAAL